MLPLRLSRVVGFEGRCNDVLFQPAAVRNADHNQTLVFFGGDIQDYPEVMQAHRDYKKFMRWNLESTARMLADNFPGKHILVVRPSRIEHHSYSCYDNFVPSNNAGIPDHTPNYGALMHLQRLLQGVTDRLKLLPPSELLETGTPGTLDVDCQQPTSTHADADKTNGSTQSEDLAEHRKPADSGQWRVPLDKSALTLVGFSKGCVVLNQLVYEYHYTSTLTPGNHYMLGLIERVCEMWWVDGGHGGGTGTWLTARSLLETLARRQMRIMVHVSPYQVCDATRPWIGRDERIFTTMLTELGAQITRILHKSPGEKPSLQMHFDVLENFKRAQDSNTRYATLNTEHDKG